MRVWPVIKRELRSQARQPFTFNLRVLGVLALLAGGAAYGLDHAFTAAGGASLFSYLHTALFVAIWILVPISAADCLSRERREGTLGLLFLTPLKAADIVIAKGAAHGLRAATLWAAVLPVLTIPFLLGGLSWQQAAVSALATFSSVCWALAAALMASSWSRGGSRATATAAAFAVCALAAFAFIVGYLMLPRLPISRSSPWMRAGIDYTWLLGLSLVSVGMGHWQAYLTMFAPAQIIWAMAKAALVSVAALAAAVGLAAFHLRRTWRQEPPPAWRQAVERRFCTPVLWLPLYRRWMRWKLERNPIGWLEQRTWSGRLVMWSWLAVLTGFYSTVISGEGFYLRNFQKAQGALAWLLILSIAATAAGSFRRERESGVLELLLVAPLNTRQIIHGRVRGIWAQFLPAVALLWTVWMFVASFQRRVNAWDGVWVIVVFATLPVIGLYYSLAKPHFLSAFLWTLLVGCVLPMMVVNVNVLLPLTLLSMGASPPLPARFLVAAQGQIWGLVQIVLALVFARRLRRNLEQRRFALERRSA